MLKIAMGADHRGYIHKGVIQRAPFLGGRYQKRIAMIDEWSGL